MTTRKVTRANQSAVWEEVIAAAKADAATAPPTRECHQNAAKAAAIDPGRLGSRGEGALLGALGLAVVVIVALLLSGCACGHAADMRRMKEGVDLILEFEAKAEAGPLTPEEKAARAETRRKLGAIATKAMEDANGE